MSKLDINFSFICQYSESMIAFHFLQNIDLEVAAETIQEEIRDTIET